MPALSNTRWELYCLGIVQGKPASKAASDAGYEPQTSTALKKQPEIAARIAELIEDKTRFKAQLDEGSDSGGGVEISMDPGLISQKWVMSQLMQNALDARRANQFTASNQALRMMGEEMGMFSKKTPDADPNKPEALETTVTSDDINKLLIAMDTTKAISVPVNKEVVNAKFD